jgi:hypothetical protein
MTSQTNISPAWPVERLSRRAALRHVGLGTLLAMGLWPGASSVQAASGENGSFRFLVANDLHCQSAECGAWLERVVQQMRGETAEFCLLCGDVSDRGDAEHLAMVRDVFGELRVPVQVAIGNHDYVSADRREPFERLFPRQLNYFFEHRGWQMLGLDTTDGQRWDNTRIQPATLRWLDDHLPRLDQRKPTVVFTHFPLGAGVSYRPANADAVLERLRGFNLKAVFGGHWHGYTIRWLGQAFALTNKCCALRRQNHDGTPGKGYLICEAKAGLVSCRYVDCRLTTAEQALLRAQKG